MKTPCAIWSRCALFAKLFFLLRSAHLFEVPAIEINWFYRQADWSISNGIKFWFHVIWNSNNEHQKLKTKKKSNRYVRCECLGNQFFVISLTFILFPSFAANRLLPAWCGFYSSQTQSPHVHACLTGIRAISTFAVVARVTGRFSRGNKLLSRSHFDDGVAGIGSHDPDDAPIYVHICRGCLSYRKSILLRKNNLAHKFHFK